MPKTKISEYSATNSSNTDIEGINIDEGCAPSGINNAIRELMVHLKEFQTGASGDAFTFAGGTLMSGTNTISGAAIISGNINSSGSANTFSGGVVHSGTNTFSSSVIMSGNINSSGTNTFSGSNVMSFSGGSSASPSIYFASDTNTGIFSPAADTIAFTEGGAEAMRIDSSGNLLVGITSARANAGDVQVSKGISFPATQSAQSDANTLDDYEEGTWTPSIGGNATYTAQTGTYTKIGRLVTIQGDITINVIGTGSIYTISGLPFTAGAQQWGSVGGFTGLNTGNIVFISCYVDSGATNLSFNGLSAAGVTSGLLAPFKNGAQIAFSISYYS